MNPVQEFFSPYIASGQLRPSPGTVWMQHNGPSAGIDYKWKMHIAATGVTDWERVARVIVPWLIANGVTFKTIQPDEFAISRILTTASAQYAKAFTIYPGNADEFMMIARGLDKLMTGANLQKNITFGDAHNMAFEHSLGHSGRLFYRVERTPDGKYMSATQARQINPQNPFNPFNEPDPFAHMFDTRSAAFYAGRARMEQILAELSQLTVRQDMLHSSDGMGASVYLVPKNDGDYPRIQQLLRATGLQYDQHFSHHFGANVFRISQSEFSALTR